MFPDAFEKVAAALQRLPGVGAKTAQRYVFSLMQMGDEVKDVAESIAALAKLHRCPHCGFLTDEELCSFCKDKDRDPTRIMVVAYDQDVAAIEKTNGYKGLYHVLNGVITSAKGIYPEELNMDTLFDRLDGVHEVIIATPFTMDGEMTALYLDRLLKDKEVEVTRLAHGLPMGASLDYADEFTLLQALDHRRSLEEEK